LPSAASPCSGALSSPIGSRPPSPVSSPSSGGLAGLGRGDGGAWVEAAAAGLGKGR
jgi:hypothetical protein